MVNEFFDHTQKRISDDDLINGIGPLYTVDKYWRHLSDMDNAPVKLGMPLFNSKKEHIGKVIRLNKKKDMFIVKLFKPLPLFMVYAAGITLDSIVFDGE